MARFTPKLSAIATCMALVVGGAMTPQSAKADSDPFIGEMKIVGFGFCPRGWAQADGQLLPINQNDALFSIIGTIYGGDGRTTFALPDLRGRIVIAEGTGPGLSTAQLGQRSGVIQTGMTTASMPAHSHAVNANNEDGNFAGPGGKLLAAAPTGGSGNETIYSTATPNKTMSSQMISNTGSGLAIPVEDPKLGILHCIALQGIYPSRS